MTLPHLNQIKSRMRDGKDTMQIAKAFECEESAVYNCLDEARKAAFHINFIAEKSRERGTRKALLHQRSGRPVTLPQLKCLENGTERK